jgi:N-acetylmuramoyl-L-alanine amidase
MHYTASANAAGAIAWLCTPASAVSAHFVVDQTGHVTQLVSTDKIAWHAGRSAWTCQDGTQLVGLNASAIGVELVNRGIYSVGTPATGPDGVLRRWEQYPQAQIDAATELVAKLQKRGCVSTTEIIGHSDIAPGRKLDPGPLFGMTAFRMQVARFYGTI